jgi:hypothetical protein
MGYPEDEARGALRFSLGRETTAEQIDEAARLVARTIGVQHEAVANLRARELVLAATRLREPGANANVEAAAE